MYTQEVKNSTFHVIYSILRVMLGLHVPKIITYLIERVVLFLYPFFFMIHSFGKNQFLKELLWKYFLACWIHFLSLRVIFC